MKLKQLSIGLVTGALAMVMIPAAVSAAAMTVKDLNEDGWSVFERDTGTIDITNEFGAPAGLGSEAIVIKTPLSNAKAYTAHAAPANLQLDDLTRLDYYAYRSAASAESSVDGQAPALNLFIDIDGNTTADTTLVYEPLYQTAGAAGVVPDSWQLWNAGNDGAKWWSTNPIASAPNRNTFPTLAEIKASNSSAVVLGYAINQGGGNPGLIGAVDGLAVNDTVYSFEATSAPTPTFPVSKEDCKKNGYQEFTGKQFRNQGECVSYVASKGKNSSNPVDSFVNGMRSLF